jgi:hypothetical protein
MQSTAEQNAQIIQEYWPNGSARCPVDKERLNLKLQSIIKAPISEYLLHGNCPSCELEIRATSKDDPKFSSFRKWTEDDLSAVAKSYSTKKSAACPVCGNSVKINAPMGLKAKPLILNCSRCGNNGQVVTNK